MVTNIRNPDASEAGLSQMDDIAEVKLPRDRTIRKKLMGLELEKL